MEHYKLLAFFTFLYAAVVASHAELKSEDYWEKMLPNTPMPNAILHSLYSENGADVKVEQKGVAVSVGPGNKGTNVHVGKGGTSVKAGPKGKNVYVTVKPGHPSPFIYKYAATQTQILDDPNVALFFLEKDLKPRTQMSLHFTKTTNEAAFLPRQVADSIPFSSKKLPEILDRFSVKPESEGAGVIAETVKECEENGVEGEDKYCATSLEGMLDYTMAKLGSNVKAVSTETKKEAKEQQQQVYTFVGVRKMSTDDRVVACHKLNYAYAVFYCHTAPATRAYTVHLVGSDGSRVEAAAVCHVDTSKWNPKHLAFQVLKVKPGTVPICHFLPEDHVVWVPK